MAEILNKNYKTSKQKIDFLSMCWCIFHRFLICVLSLNLQWHHMLEWSGQIVQAQILLFRTFSELVFFFQNPEFMGKSAETQNQWKNWRKKITITKRERKKGNSSKGMTYFFMNIYISAYIFTSQYTFLRHCGYCSDVYSSLNSVGKQQIADFKAVHFYNIFIVRLLFS